MPALAGDPHRGEGGDLEADIAVLERRTRMRAQRLVGSLRGESVQVPTAHLVVHVRRQAAGARQALAQGQPALVVAVELLDVARDRVVQFELALIDQRQDRRHREPLAGRRDRDHLIGGERPVQAAVQFAAGAEHAQAGAVGAQDLDDAVGRGPDTVEFGGLRRQRQRGREQRRTDGQEVAHTALVIGMSPGGNGADRASAEPSAERARPGCASRRRPSATSGPFGPSARPTQPRFDLNDDVFPPDLPHRRARRSRRLPDRLPLPPTRLRPGLPLPGAGPRLSLTATPA